MTTIAQGTNKVTAIGLQVALGTPKVTAGNQILRRKTSVFIAARDMYESDEIVTHHQSTGSSYGVKKSSGRIDGLLSSGTYQVPFEGLLEADAVTVAPYAAGIDVTATVGGPQFVDASAGYLTAGLKVGMVGRWTGWTSGTSAANNAKNFLITALTAGNMTGVFLNGDAVVAQAATDAVTFTVVGQVMKTPMTGHLKKYHTIEEWYPDIAKSELFPDMLVSQIAVGLPATGNATFGCDFVGNGLRTLGAAQAMSAPTAETTTGIMGAINGFVYVNGALAGNITGSSLQISNSAAAVGAVVGSNNSPDVSQGRIKVSGSFTGLYDSSTFSALYDAETNISLMMVLTADQTGTSDFMSFWMGKVKITGDTPDDGEKGIVRSYPFTAELNGAGGAALAWDKTIISVQDSAAA